MLFVFCYQNRKEHFVGLLLSCTEHVLLYAAQARTMPKASLRFAWTLVVNNCVFLIPPCFLQFPFFVLLKVAQGDRGDGGGTLPFACVKAYLYQDYKKIHQ